MEIKGTKRSQHDGTLVHFSTRQFEGTDLYLPFGYVGDEVTLVIDGVPTVCTFARPGKDGWPTALTTRGLPRHIRLPRVGRPIYVEVSEIR